MPNRERNFYEMKEMDEDRNLFREDDYFSERDRRYHHPFRRKKTDHYGKGPRGWKWSDERVKEQVSETLYRDYNVDASDIEVSVKEGVVTLSGSVDSREAKCLAEESIENLTGVVDVHNRLRIGASSAEKRTLS